MRKLQANKKKTEEVLHRTWPPGHWPAAELGRALSMLSYKWKEGVLLFRNLSSDIKWKTPQAGYCIYSSDYTVFYLKVTTQASEFFFTLRSTFSKHSRLLPSNHKAAFNSNATHCTPASVDTNLTAGRGSQDVVGVHGAQLVPAAIPAGLALDADDLVNPFQAVHTHCIQMHESPCTQKAQGSGGGYGGKHLHLQLRSKFPTQQQKANILSFE